MNYKQTIEQYNRLFDCIRGKSSKIKVNTIILDADAHFQCIRLTRLSDLGSLAPPKKVGKGGKMETPKCFDVVFDKGVLTFELDATIITPLVCGIELQIGENNVRFECE